MQRSRGGAEEWLIPARAPAQRGLRNGRPIRRRSADALDDLGDDLQGEHREADQQDQLERPDDRVPAARARALAGADRPSGSGPSSPQVIQATVGRTIRGEADQVEDSGCAAGSARCRAGRHGHGCRSTWRRRSTGRTSAPISQVFKSLPQLGRRVEGVAQHDVVEHQDDERRSQHGGGRPEKATEPVLSPHVGRPPPLHSSPSFGKGGWMRCAPT